MKKELEDSLRYMQSHPTTGLPHNQQIVSTQVETIFALDELKQQVAILNKTIEASDKQSQKLEKSNYRLQQAMLILTAIATMIAAYPVILSLIKWVSPYVEQLFRFGSISISLISVLAGILSALTGFLAITIEKKLYEKNFFEIIKIKDSMDAVLKDRDGNIKETRHVE